MATPNVNAAAAHAQDLYELAVERRVRCEVYAQIKSRIDAMLRYDTDLKGTHALDSVRLRAMSGQLKDFSTWIESSIETQERNATRETR